MRPVEITAYSTTLVLLFENFKLLELIESDYSNKNLNKLLI